MKAYILVDPQGKTMRVLAQNPSYAIQLANTDGFEVWDWEVEEGEDFDV